MDNKDEMALIWVGEDGEEKRLTYGQLDQLAGQMASRLVGLGVGKGDRVFIYLPRILEVWVAFLGTLRLGAVATTLFSALGEQAVAARVADGQPKVVVTSPNLAARLPKGNYEIILSGEEFWQKLEKEQGHGQVEVSETDPVFMLYTSGTTGKPKGIVHGRGVIEYEIRTAREILGLKPGVVYWCTADPGWVTGVAYGILGSLGNLVTQIVYGGRFDPEKWLMILAKYRVEVWYTAPTALRLLAGSGVDVKKYDLSALRQINSVGEPLNPEIIRWGQKHLGLPIYDTYWQTETGGIVIANRPGLPIKPGSMGRPVEEVEARVSQGLIELNPRTFPVMQEVYKQSEKYWERFANRWYKTGDEGRVDSDGYFWFTGRSDDLINTAGEKVSPFEVESALVTHPAVVEAGVVGVEDEKRGQIVKAFVVLGKNYRGSEELKKQLQVLVKTEVAGFAYPKIIEFVKDLPKTESGKIMRRKLRDLNSH